MTLSERPTKAELTRHLEEAGVGFRFVTGVPNGLLVYLTKDQPAEPVVERLGSLGEVLHPVPHVLRVNFPAVITVPPGASN